MADIVVHGLRFHLRPVRLKSITALAMLCGDGQPRVLRDTPDTWHIPYLSTTESGEYDLWQSPYLWRFILNRQLPEHINAYICRPDQDPNLVAEIREFINFQSVSLVTNRSEVLLEIFYASTTLEGTVAKLFSNPGEPVSYKLIRDLIGDDKVSESAIYRARKKARKTKPISNIARFNRFCKRFGLPHHDEIYRLLTRFNPDAADRFTKAVHKENSNYAVLCKNIVDYLREHGVLPVSNK